ncbi:MAG: hypothetical protein WCL21_07465 [Mariniphaga sp.]
MGDKYNWTQSADGFWHYTVFVEGGKLANKNGYAAKTSLREIAGIHQGTFILTGNQNVVIALVSELQKPVIEALLAEYNIINADKLSQLRQISIACAAFLAEIGLAGRAPGLYNLYLGASFVGDRFNKLYREKDEHFGDFVIRNNYIKATTEGKRIEIFRKEPYHIVRQ